LDDANSWAHHLTVMALDCTDCLEEANGYLDYALTESRRRGDAAIAVVFLAFRARVAFRTGAVADGDSWCRIADELTIGPEAFTAVPFVLCDVLAEQGRGDDAEQMMQAYPNVSAPQHTAVYDLMCGRAALAAGHDEEALEALLRAGEILEALELRHPNFVPWRAYAVAAARGCGRLDLARRLAEEDLAISRRTESTSALGRALRSCALVDEDRSSARNLLEESCAVLAQSLARLDEAYSIVELGALLRADDRALARDVLRQGLDLAVRCDASALVERARRELVAAGGRPRRLVTSGIDALTPSERQVARMAGEGMTNREIAQALFVTLKTVEHHLGSTYDKLAISGRRALAGALQVAGGAGG
jgi:DNA-binding CsgD family transcriptional regulator